MPVFSEDNGSEVEFLGTQPVTNPPISNKPLLLYSLSQDVQLSQLPPTSSAITRRSRGVAPKKTRAQLEMESQQKSEAALKQAKAEGKRQEEEKKIAKAMKPRKDDVSQLVDSFSELGSSP